jgi:hypothetical protein
MSKRYNQYVELVMEGTLPSDFNQWELADLSGWTVAHTAAKHGTFPASFSQWGLADKNGWTVAHNAALRGNLPVLGPDSDLWVLADKNGWTVAHAAAGQGLLPEDFDQWGLTDNGGMTVLSCLSLSAHLDMYMPRWEKEEPLWKADVDWSVFKKELPEIYQKYAINGYMPDADNDREALQGALL